MEAKRLAERIAERRRELGMTQADLAKVARVSSAAVSYWETGDTKNLKNDNLFAIADALRVEARWLAIGQGPKVRRVASLAAMALLTALLAAPQQSEALETSHNYICAQYSNGIHIVRRLLRRAFAVLTDTYKNLDAVITAIGTNTRFHGKTWGWNRDARKPA